MKKYILLFLVGLPVLTWGQTQKLDTLKDHQLDHVVIRAKGTGTYMSKMDPRHSQRITSAELQRAACCNLSEAFETNPSVDVSYSDAATGAKQIKLLGLSGSYVQMQTENVPGLRGVNAQYGLDYIPGPWMESIQISKGAASVKNGFESMTGQINVEYKKSERSDPLTVNMYGADNGRMEINVDGSHKFNEDLSSGLFVHYSNDKQNHDANGDGFLDRPKLEQLNVMNRWNFAHGPWVSHWGARVLTDRRDSGQEDMGESATERYKIDIKNNHAEFYGKQGYIMDREKSRSLALIVSGSMTDYKAGFGHLGYDAKEGHLYASLLFETEFSVHHSLSTGVSMQADLLHQQTAGLSLLPGSIPDRNNQWIPGAYLEYTYKPFYNVTILGGIRADHHNQYGWFVTPRVHLKYDPVEWLNLRASVGKGYRSVNVLNEYNYLLASSRAQQLTIANNLPMEESLNYGVSATAFVHVAEKELTLSAEFYSTHFQQQIIMDNETSPNAVSFYALQGKSYADNAQFELSYPLFTGLELRTAYRFVNAKSTYNHVLMEKALQSRHKGFLTVSYKTPDPHSRWQFDYTLQLNGGGRMPTPDVQQPLWENHFHAYTITHVQASKFFTWGSVYVGAENLFNQKQKNPIIGADDPFGTHFDATMIWGPVHGRSVYAGLRYILK